MVMMVMLMMRWKELNTERKINTSKRNHKQLDDLMGKKK